MTKFRNIFIAMLAALGFAATSAAALAESAQSTTWLNVRSGPGTSYGVVDTLAPGEEVEVTECAANGWCFIEHTGPDGWVSSSYLAPADAGATPSDPDCSFQMTIGPSGPTFSIVCGDQPPAPAPTPTPPTPSGNTACFYTGNNYSGSEFCHGPATLNTLDSTFNDNISSVRLYGNAKAKLCVNANLGGYCRTVVNNVPILGPLINDRASSLVVYTGIAPIPVTPVTYSTGPINLPQTHMANLDNGNVGAAGADIWYQAVSPVQKYITPRNGAVLALGDGSNRGYAGCAAESFSGNKIPLWSLPIGSYVCAKTNQGRISQFRLNGYTGTTMNLGYTTWAN